MTYKRWGWCDGCERKVRVETLTDHGELSLCKSCLRGASPERERGDDDGVEYGHPGDHLRGVE